MNTLIKTACLTCVLVLLSITSTANAQQSTNLVAEISEEWYDPFEPNSNTYNESKGDIQFGADPYDGYSPIYALSLPTSGEVTLVLDTGANIDGYLYLLNSDYKILSEDDNSGEYERSSITQTLDAGTYYVVPTGKRTNSGYVERFDMNIELYSDDFEANDELLKVVNYDSIKSLIGASQVQYYQDEAGSWQDTSGQSYTSAGNPRYKVVLTEAAALQISLESETDSYLYLLDENLNILEKDDDDGVGLDARISQTLAAGTYYVVAATFSTFNNSGTAFTLNLLSKDIMSDDISVELEAVTAENLSINIRMTLGNEQKDVYGVGAVGILQITPFENSDSTCQPLLYIFDIDRKVNPGGQKEGVSSTLEMPVFNACEYDMKLDLLQNTVFRQASGTFPAVLTAEDYLALTDGQKLSFRQLDNNNPGHSYSYGTFSVTVNENGAVTDTVRLSETREDNLGKFTNGNSSLRIEAGVSTDRADLDLQVQQDLYDQIDNIVIASGSDDEVILTFQNTTEESTKGSIFHINRSGSEEGVYITQSLPLLNSAYSYSAVYLKGGQKYNKTGEFTFTRGNGNNDVKGNLVFDLNSNTPPLANDQEINIYEETVLTFDLDVSDVDGDVLTYLLLSQGSKGSVEISQDGNATYFANPGATGTDTFTYRASDGTADSNEATVTMTIDAAESRQISVTGTVNFDDLAEDFGLGANVELNVSPFDNAPSYCGSFSFSFSATTENIDDTRNMTVHNRCEYDLELIIDGDANDFDRQRGTFSVGVVNNNIGIVKSSGDGVSADVTSLTIGGGISTDTGLLDAHIQQQVRGEIQDIVLTGNDDIYMEYTNQDFPKLADKIFSSLKTDGVFISQPLPLVTSEYAYSIVYVKGGEELTQTGSFSFNTGNANPTATFSVVFVQANTPPVISGTPATTVAQGTNYSFTPSAADQDPGTNFTFSIDNMPTWALFNAKTGNLTGTPGANDVGTSSNIIITVSDGEVPASLVAFAITVSNVNDAPVISGTPATTVAQGTNYSFTPTASDADTDTTLTFSIDNMPTWASFNAKTGSLTGTPSANDVSTTSNIVITVEDGEAEASLAAFAITVSNINDAPVISGTPATTVAQGTNYSFTPTASDADTDTTLTFSIDNKPNWAVFNAQTGSLTGTPSANDVGSTSGIVITVSDGDEQASLAFAITVSNVNDAPVFTNTPALTVAQGSQYSFIPIVTDPDSDDTFTFSITSKPAWAEFSVETGSLIGTPGANDEGISSIISITVSDSGTPTETASLSFSIEVSIEESVDEVAPVLAVPADTTFEAIDASGIPVTNAGVVSLLAQASATDAVDSIGGISTPVTNNLTGTHLPLGETTIVFMATDESGNTESASTKITVVDTTAPVLTLLGQASLTVEIDETFVDPGFTALDNVDGDLSTAVVVTGQVDINTVGDYVLSYNVSDAQGNASQSMTRQVKVTDGLPIIQAPVALTVFTNSVDGLSVSDAQVQGFLNSATASDKQDGEITTISNDAPQTLLAGETIVIFIVTDSTGNVSNAQSTITVVFDAEAPMVAETATLSVEATGTLTEVSLTAPEVTDNRSSDLTATPSDNGPFPLGDTEVIWQTVDMAGNTASRIQTVSIVDTTAPLFEDMTRITLEATGVSTNIDELLDIKAFDLVDGDIVAEIVGQILFGSGVHLITLSATDNQGQTATVEAEIAIIPLVIIAESAFASPGQTSTLALTLTGEAVIYPVTLNYTVSANNTAIEQSQVVIESGVDSAIEFTVDASMLADTELSVALTAAQNAILGEQTSGVITVTAVNLAPIAIISVSQQGSPTGIIALDGGDITVTAQVTDVGPATNYGFNWDESTLGNLGIDASVVLSVEQLTLGTMSLLLTLEELDTAEQFLVTVGKKLIVKQTLSLTSDADSDLDGMSDAMEGAGDSDDDGIPDYLDSDATANVLPVDNGASVIIAPVGIKLSLGAALVQASNGQASGVKITPQQLSEVFDSQPTEDDEYQAVGDIINFKASGLTQAGDSVTVIVQLADGLSVPAEAVYRKFSEVNGWLTFISDGNNQIASGNTDVNGNCPAFTNEMYLAGLVPGSNCIALTIQDGGIYDADGETNGQIEDPGVLAVESINLEPIVDTVNVVSAPEQSSFSLTATATDPEEQSLLYIWTQTAGTPVVIPDDSAETLAFTTPDVAEDEDLTFQLSVSDGVNEVLHTLVLTVLNVNSVPTLSASASASSALEESSVSFTATANDADGQALTFTWVQLSGPDLNLGETTSNSFTVTLPSVASNSIVVLKVTVSDGIDSVSQEVSLTIQNQTTVTPTPTPPTPDGGGGGSIGGFTLFLLALGLFRLAYSRRKYHY
jgi:hypothetical protein